MQEDDVQKKEKSLQRVSLEMFGDVGLPQAHQTLEFKVTLNRTQQFVMQPKNKNSQNFSTLYEDGYEGATNEDHQSIVDEVAVDTHVQSDVMSNLQSNNDVPHLEQNVLVSIIPEAFLIEEESNFMAAHTEPLLPWWKQKRPCLLFILLFFVFVALAISLGIPLSLNEMTMVVASPTSHFPSTAQTTESSSTPTSSLMSTFSPTTCSYKILTRAQKSNLLISEPKDPMVAVDRRDAVVVTSSLSSARIYVIFYLLTDDEWVMMSYFI